MQLRYSIFSLALLITQIITAQIVNVESLRQISDTSTWSGGISLDMSLIKNKRQIFTLKNRSRVQYQKNRHLALFINDFSFKEVDTKKIINKGIQHLRYNYKLKHRMALEAFTQSQHDAISNIKFRGLMGSGPRFKLSPSEKYRLYLGTLIMYEYEEIEELSAVVIHRDFRSSSYFSCSLYPSDRLAIVSTTYYQPKLNQWSDFRISTETSLALPLHKNLAYKATFALNYDRFPALGVPDTQYEFTNGLIYTFD